jgi:hypothetical protein
MAGVLDIGFTMMFTWFNHCEDTLEHICEGNDVVAHHHIFRLHRSTGTLAPVEQPAYTGVARRQVVFRRHTVCSIVLCDLTPGLSQPTTFSRGIGHTGVVFQRYWAVILNNEVLKQDSSLCWYTYSESQQAL